MGDWLNNLGNRMQDWGRKGPDRSLGFMNKMSSKLSSSNFGNFAPRHMWGASYGLMGARAAYGGFQSARDGNYGGAAVGFGMAAGLGYASHTLLTGKQNGLFNVHRNIGMGINKGLHGMANRMGKAAGISNQQFYSVPGMKRMSKMMGMPLRPRYSKFMSGTAEPTTRAIARFFGKDWF